jgi:class 3 adenylate cyclase
MKEEQDPLKKENPDTMNITTEDISSIRSYIEQRNTAMLIVMFTDIQGYTRINEERGDAYANEMREEHNRILQDVIEADSSGKIIKYIGDAIMAVFSEPTTAVDKAVEIQYNLDQYNKEHPDKEDIIIRIGLHMGQVAVDNKISADIFGRHVNRASRIESLAQGNQIFMSYPVFDSAKGWLTGRRDLGWQDHGFYYLKGIPDPIQIFEVYDARFAKSAAPKKAKKKRAIPSLVFLLASFLLGGLLSYAIIKYEPATVYLFDFKVQDVRLDHSEQLFLDGNQEDDKKLVLSKLKPGRHLLNTTDHYLSRYFSILEIKNGENLIEPQFIGSRMPTLNLRTSFEEGEDTHFDTKKEEDSFIYFNEALEQVNVDSVLRLDTSAERTEENMIQWTIDWSAQVNDQVISGQETWSHPADQSETTRKERFTLWAGPFFDFEIRWYSSRETIDISLEGSWKKFDPTLVAE